MTQIDVYNSEKTELNELRQGTALLEIIWSNEEDCFKLSGHIKRHNCVYWSFANHVTIKEQLIQPCVTARMEFYVLDS
jgi:hypothetical protein